MPRIFGGFLGRRSAAEDLVGTPAVTDHEVRADDQEKQNAPRSEDGSSTTRSHIDSDGEQFTEGAQEGVKAMEAMTTVWTKSTLAAALVFIVFLSFVGSMQQQMGFGLEPYVLSDYDALGLLATTGVVSQLVSGIARLPLAKILDIWGRPQGFAVMLVLVTVGLVMMATTNSATMYSAAQVFYWTGVTGRDLCISVFLADTTSLKNRGFMYALETSPFLATTWIGGPLADAFLSGPGWRWGYGTFAIIEPAVNIPLIVLFMWYTRKAKQEGVLVEEKLPGRTFFQTVKYYTIQFDLVGVLILAAGLALFLLPFNIYSRAPDGWATPYIIAMLVLGVVLIVAFVLYEAYVAPVQFAPFHILKDRNVLGSSVLMASLACSFGIWASFMSPFVQIVYRVSVTEAVYIGNIYTLGSCVMGIVCGALIRWSGRFKWLAAYIGVPMVILGVGMLIEFRQPNYNIGPMIFCQILIAFGGGIIVICSQISAMSSVTHQYIAVVLALQLLFFSVGQAIGYSISTPLWAEYFPTSLQRLLPPETQDLAAEIAGSLATQLEYEPGSPTRDAIDQAYGIAMEYQMIAACAVLAVAIPAVLAWRNIKVSEFKQTKGKVW